ncbi:MAG: aldehyde dehydrogenase family protein [Planctomycetaceae bacterium]|nr:aldehyde dehydrogenase family protein [Planctomycetaceae bacterium]
MTIPSELLGRLGLASEVSGVFSDRWLDGTGTAIESINPATAKSLARVRTASRAEYDLCLAAAQAAFLRWRLVPAPQRGELIRRFGQALRDHKQDLGLLVTLETGKILSEGEGEVQEMIDMADFAVGLSRQLYGLTIASERPQHRMFEQWHPLGIVGVLTAFNFPVAVWAWNAMLSTVCGNATVWKPSQRTPLTAIAVQHILQHTVRETFPTEPALGGLFPLCVGAGIEAGEWLAADERVPLVSATGSCAMGRKVGAVVAGRLGRTLLELGGNNAVILTPSANLDLALRGIVFAAVGTTGQRCTTLRRLLVHESIAEGFLSRLKSAYASIPIGDPGEPGTLMGPLISEASVQAMQRALEEAKAQGGEVVCGGGRLKRPGYFVTPALVRARADMPIVGEETFAPILYVMTYRTIDEAIAANNGVRQGLSSAIFTDSLRDSERFLSAAGSDCGIANVNIGTSGAEIGGAFGGEKETGGGREAGSDAWKAYMRRQTCTINGGDALPLAQGVIFDVKG